MHSKIKVEFKAEGKRQFPSLFFLLGLAAVIGFFFAYREAVPVGPEKAVHQVVCILMIPSTLSKSESNERIFLIFFLSMIKTDTASETDKVPS